MAFSVVYAGKKKVQCVLIIINPSFRLRDKIVCLSLRVLNSTFVDLFVISDSQS